MDNEERTKIEIRENTLNYLVSKFDKLLLGIDTKEYLFKNKKEKEILIKGIKNYASYRIKEKNIDEKSDLWRVILKINKSKIKSKKEIERIYLKLLEIKHLKKSYVKFLGLKHPLSKYHSQKSKELGKKKGIKALKEFFKMVEKITGKR